MPTHNIFFRAKFCWMSRLCFWRSKVRCDLNMKRRKTFVKDTVFQHPRMHPVLSTNKFRNHTLRIPLPAHQVPKLLIPHIPPGHTLIPRNCSHRLARFVC